MHELSDGVIGLPRGFGTREEFFEMLTWGQSGLHKKPVGPLTLKVFFDALMDFVQNMIDKKFLKEIHQKNAFE
jgi:predicted Rossmann-fold nucleotide-binding protein